MHFEESSPPLGRSEEASSSNLVHPISLCVAARKAFQQLPPDASPFQKERIVPQRKRHVSTKREGFYGSCCGRTRRQVHVEKNVWKKFQPKTRKIFGLTRPLLQTACMTLRRKKERKKFSRICRFLSDYPVRLDSYLPLGRPACSSRNHIAHTCT